MEYLTRWSRKIECEQTNHDHEMKNGFLVAIIGFSIFCAAAYGIGYLVL